jgi:hypothetical protein
MAKNTMKEVPGVLLDLGAFVPTGHIFERKLMEAKLTPRQLNVVLGRILDVEPQDVPSVLDQIADPVKLWRLVESTFGMANGCARRSSCLQHTVCTSARRTIAHFDCTTGERLVAPSVGWPMGQSCSTSTGILARGSRRSSSPRQRPGWGSA